MPASRFCQAGEGGFRSGQVRTVPPWNNFRSCSGSGEGSSRHPGRATPVGFPLITDSRTTTGSRAGPGRFHSAPSTTKEGPMSWYPSTVLFSRRTAWVRSSTFHGASPVLNFFANAALAERAARGHGRRDGIFMEKGRKPEDQALSRTTISPRTRNSEGVGRSLCTSRSSVRKQRRPISSKGIR